MKYWRKTLKKNIKQSLIKRRIVEIQRTVKINSLKIRIIFK